MGIEISAADRKKIDPKFICTVCGLLLLLPMQTPCGHLLCKTCLDVLIQSGKPVCPADDEELEEDKVFADAFTRRELLALQLHCPNQGCMWVGTYKQYQENHMNQCKFATVPCGNEGCKKVVLKSEMPHHLKNECLYRLMKCQFCDSETQYIQLKTHIENECTSSPVTCKRCGKKGISRSELKKHEAFDCEESIVECDFKDIGCKHKKTDKRRVLQKHATDSVSYHLLLLLTFVMDLWSKLMDLMTRLNTYTAENTTELQTLKKNNEDLVKQMDTSRKLLESLQLTVNQIKTSHKMGEGSMKRNDVKESSELKTVKERMDKLSTNLERATQKNATLEQQRLEDKAIITRLRGKLEQIDESLTLTTVKLSDMEANGFGAAGIPVSYNGTLLWRIDDFKRKRKAAVDGTQKAIYSPHFYSSQFGYKMCVRIYLNGDGFGKGTHISLFFVVMRGEYDPLLSWPFQKKITMMLLDQTSGEHMVDAFRSDPDSTSFQQPKTKMNVASGSPLFLELKALPNRGYVIDNVLYVKVIVD